MMYTHIIAMQTHLKTEAKAHNMDLEITQLCYIIVSFGLGSSIGESEVHHVMTFSPLAGECSEGLRCVQIFL